jgi:EAL domain-containing protein (putative c-di-GMP-specific phosphodiesterase class I)
VGGDEFVVLLSGNKRVDMAEAIGAQLQNALKPPLRLQNCHLSIGASMGCARYPQDGEDMLTLLQRADAAMYGAKRFGIPFCYFDAGMDESSRPNLEFDLWQALERHEISLVYQPQVSSAPDRPLRGVEALMRWKHATLGDVEPNHFIALAERSGAIVPLGNWALSHACEQLRSWRNQGLPTFTLSLNTSLRQLRHPGFLDEVQKALATHQLEGCQLEMEFSETQAMLFVQSDTRHVQALREMGVRIAIDDYGISFSSLSRLNFLTISSFKINQQCVQDLTTSADARAISSCMISISKAMGIEVIAQGVETAEQADVLEQQGCHVLQGFYTGAPVPPEALAALLKKD